MNNLGSYLSGLTQEQREEMREKGAESRRLKQEWAQNNLKLSYEDENCWTELAKEANVRLPLRNVPATEVKYVRKLLKRLNIDQKEWLDVEGYSSLKQFGLNNPEWTARAHCGLVLEWWKEKNEKV